MKFYGKIQKMWPTVVSERALSRFKQFYKELGKDDCWLWEGGTNGQGTHGVFKYNASKVGTTRFAFMILHPDFDQSLEVCHTCDNGLCVNPNHLFLGTHKDNMDDRDSKLRQSYGEDRWSAVLTEQDVLDIKKLLESGMTGVDVSRRYKISTAQVSRIRNGRRWKCLGAT